MSDWYTSSYSGANNNCVEFRAADPEAVDVRDTQNRAAGHLTFPAAEWARVTEILRRVE